MPLLPLVRGRFDGYGVGVACHPGRFLCEAGIVEKACEPHGRICGLLVYRFADRRAGIPLPFGYYRRHCFGYERFVPDSRSTFDQFDYRYIGRACIGGLVAGDQCLYFNYLHSFRLVDDFTDFRERSDMNVEFWISVLLDGVAGGHCRHRVCRYFKSSAPGCFDCGFAGGGPGMPAVFIYCSVRLST